MGFIISSIAIALSLFAIQKIHSEWLPLKQAGHLKELERNRLSSAELNQALVTRYEQEHFRTALLILLVSLLPLLSLLG